MIMFKYNTVHVEYVTILQLLRYVGGTIPWGGGALGIGVRNICESKDRDP
jgi:hypothetical protein